MPTEIKATCDPQVETRDQLALYRIEEKNNVYMGIGVWSKMHGLSKGLPICFLNLLIRADKERNKLGSGKIFILIADSLALDSRSDHIEVTPDDIHERVEQYIQIIESLCAELLIENVEIERASKINETEAYQKIEKELKILLLETLRMEHGDTTTSEYILHQTALSKYYATLKNCAFKIGWRYTSEKSFDEPWFDKYCKRIGLPIDFVYAEAGIGIDIRQKQKQPRYCVPYSAADPGVDRFLFGEDREVLLRKLKNDKDDTGLLRSRAIKKSLSHLFAELKGYVSSIRSSVDNTNLDLLMLDLINVAALPTHRLIPTFTTTLPVVSQLVQAKVASSSIKPILYRAPTVVSSLKDVQETVVCRDASHFGPGNQA